jgi:SSS family solute:Na+ symporter
MPLVVVLPGIAAVVLSPGLDSPDQAYPEVMKMLPVGIKGLVFAALLAAIVSSLSSMVNSISTIFTLDIYSYYLKKTDDEHLVTVGRTVSIVSLIIAMVCAKPLLGNFDQAFQYIQEFTGFFTPGIVAIFLLGLFWPAATTHGALAAAIGSALLSLLLKQAFPNLPFIDRVSIVFFSCLALAIVISLAQKKSHKPTPLPHDDIDFSTSSFFNIATLGITLVLVAFYAAWW